MGNGSEGNFSALYIIVEVSPPPSWTCPLHPLPPNIQPLHPPSSIPSTPPPRWGWAHGDYDHWPPPPLPPLLQTRRAVTAWVDKRRYLYSVNLINPVQDMESSPYDFEIYILMGTGYMFGFFNTMIWNTKQCKLAYDKIIRSAHGLYLATIIPPVGIHVSPPLPIGFHRWKTWIWSSVGST